MFSCVFVYSHTIADEELVAFIYSYKICQWQNPFKRCNFNKTNYKMSLRPTCKNISIVCAKKSGIILEKSLSRSSSWSVNEVVCNYRYITKFCYELQILTLQFYQ